MKRDIESGLSMDQRWQLMAEVDRLYLVHCSTIDRQCAYKRFSELSEYQREQLKMGASRAMGLARHCLALGL